VVIIAEIGVDMTGFPTPGHLCSWAKFGPDVKTSAAGKNKGNGSTGHGNRYLGVRAARRELIALRCTDAVSMISKSDLWLS
jgi:transposase